MSLFTVTLWIIYVISCFFLMFVVLIQKGEGGGLGGAFGGGAVDVAFGAKADSTWKAATSVSAACFMVLAIVLGIMQTHAHNKSMAGAAASDEAAERDDGPTDPNSALTEPGVPGATETPAATPSTTDLPNGG